MSWDRGLGTLHRILLLIAFAERDDELRIPMVAARNLTQHGNWQPDPYRDASKHWGIEPDPAVLSVQHEL